jgi:ribosomal-protein-alanine N-acetyltransferase
MPGDRIADDRAVGAGLTYRPLASFDVDLLAALHGQSFDAAWDRPWSPRSFADVLAMPGAAGQLAILNDAPIGFGLTLAAVDEVELLLLAILPAHRRQGHAGHLLTALLQAAQANGAGRAILEVAGPNSAAIACYRRAGFTPCGRRKAYYDGKIDALIFEKLL